MTSDRDPRLRVWEQLLDSVGLVEQLDVFASPVLARGSIRFGQLTALVGLHGAGKTYLLSALADGLPRWQSNMSLPIDSSGHSAELSGEYRLTLRPGSERRDVDYTRPIDWRARREIDTKLMPLTVTMLTPFIALSDLTMATQDYAFLEKSKLTNRMQLRRRQLETLRDITGHDYRSLEYGYFDSEDFQLPFVQGVRDSREINTWSMSTSEFWVHYVLAHLNSADQNEVVLIDEPESYLAQPGHRAFIDEIARLTLASGCQTIIATHSDTMVRRIPAALVRQVTQSPQGASFMEVSQTGALLRVLGRERLAVSALVFVEDDLAVALMHALLDRYAPDKVDLFDVIDSGGKDQALRGAAIVRGSQRLQTIVVLDADQRDVDQTGDAFFLPGVDVPESELLASLRTREIDAAERLRVSLSDLRIALEAARFVAHQRVFTAMSASLMVCSANDLRDVAIDLWLEADGIAAAARVLVEEMLTLTFPAP